MEQALDRFGRIDSLINMAGIYIGKPFTEYTPDDLATITAVNLTGFFHITQRVIAQMVAQGTRPRRQHDHELGRPTPTASDPPHSRPSPRADSRL